MRHRCLNPLRIGSEKTLYYLSVGILRAMYKAQWRHDPHLSHVRRLTESIRRRFRAMSSPHVIEFCFANFPCRLGLPGNKMGAQLQAYEAMAYGIAPNGGHPLRDPRSSSRCREP